jgi:hypothetical protein
VSGVKFTSAQKSPAIAGLFSKNSLLKELS